MFDETKIFFKKLTNEDLPLLHTWLNEPFVKEWFGKNDVTFNEISEKYTPRINGEEPVQCFIVHYQNTPVSYIQTYRVSDFPDTAKHFQVDAKTSGIDVFIGNRDYVGKGFGSLMMKKFLQEVVFAAEDILSCLVDPEPNNTQAIKSYEKVGFRYFTTIQIPGESSPKYLMKIDKSHSISPSFVSR